MWGPPPLDGVDTDADSGAGSVRVVVRVHPGAKRTEVGGSYDGALAVRVTARAVDGAATAAAVRALAEAFGVPRRHVVLIKGATSRTKVVDIAGADPQVLRDLLER